MASDLIGWASTAVLIMTIGRQAYTQWREGSTAGVSKWLFIGQLISSTGFVAYSALLHNVVFTVSNVFLLLIAVVGQWLYVRNRRREAARHSSSPGGAARASA